MVVVKGYYFELGLVSGSSGPFNSKATVGFSTKSLLAIMIVAVTLIFVPPPLAMLRLPANSIVVGSNSLAIAAACHVSPLTGKNLPSTSGQPSEAEIPDSDDGIELRHLMAPSPGLGDQHGNRTLVPCKDDEERRAALRKISQSKVRWGVVRMPTEWADDFNTRENPVEHISFGVSEDEVEDPVEGHWYA